MLLVLAAGQRRRPCARGLAGILLCQQAIQRLGADRASRRWIPTLSLLPGRSILSGAREQRADFTHCSQVKAARLISAALSLTGPQQGDCMAYFFNQGLSLHYQLAGTGQPTLLLHGGSVSYEQNYQAFGWTDCLVSHGLQVIGLDFRGHGRSDKPADAQCYGVLPLARDALALMDHLGIQRCNLLGYSMGSAVALQLVRMAPERFARAVLMGTGDALMGVGPLVISAVLPQLADAVLRDSYPEDLPAHVRAYWKLVRKSDGHPQAIALAFQGEFPAISPADVAKISVPILVVSGDSDPVLGQGRTLASTLLNGQYLEVVGADHFSLAADVAVQDQVATFFVAP